MIYKLVWRHPYESVEEHCHWSIAHRRFSTWRGKWPWVNSFQKRINFMVFPYLKGFHVNKVWIFFILFDIFTWLNIFKFKEKSGLWNSNPFMIIFWKFVYHLIAYMISSRKNTQFPKQNSLKSNSRRETYWHLKYSIF